MSILDRMDNYPADVTDDEIAENFGDYVPPKEEEDPDWSEY